ncbi:MAG TPA: BON domain-containing protein [Nitrospira sp.]|nr:BON domain-containing protein [Nitrospira sp.]
MWSTFLFALAVVAAGGMPAVNDERAQAFAVQGSSEIPSDIQLQSAVSQAMRTSPLTAHSHIVVHVSQGEVTLEGAAMSALARREATRLAETVLGVRQVHNRLSVINQHTAETPPHEAQ